MRLNLFVLLTLFSLPLAAETTTYRMLIGGLDTGHLVVDRHGEQIAIDYDFKQNGRGPTIAEEITLDKRGYPVAWTISGTTTFGSVVDEYFRVEDRVARWRDSTGTGEAALEGDGETHPYRTMLLRVLREETK